MFASGRRETLSMISPFRDETDGEFLEVDDVGDPTRVSVILLSLCSMVVSCPRTSLPDAD